MIRQAFLLAGGRGERLRPLTDSLPKPLVKVKGRPIIEYSIELLRAHGVREVVVACGYLHEKLISHLDDGRRFGMDIVYAVEDEPLGTGGCLKEAEELLEESFFMLNGDNIADFDLRQMEGLHSNSKALGTIALVQAADTAGYGVVEVEGGKIIDFAEKPPGMKGAGLVNAGAYVLEKKALELLPPGFSLIERTLFPELARQRQLGAWMHNGLWFTTDTPERLQAAEHGLSRRPSGIGFK